MIGHVLVHLTEPRAVTVGARRDCNDEHDAPEGTEDTLHHRGIVSQRAW
jgi:hypothetical protein